MLGLVSGSKCAIGSGRDSCTIVLLWTAWACWARRWLHRHHLYTRLAGSPDGCLPSSERLVISMRHMRYQSTGASSRATSTRMSSFAEEPNFSSRSSRATKVLVVACTCRARAVLCRRPALAFRGSIFGCRRSPPVRRSRRGRRTLRH